MKIKYLVYGILIVSFGGFISYRIIEKRDAEADNNKLEKRDAFSRHCSSTRNF
jgi:hypothetical protein